MMLQSHVDINVWELKIWVVGLHVAHRPLTKPSIKDF